MEPLTPRLANSSEVSVITQLINLAFRKESFFKKGDRIDESGVREKMKEGSLYVVEGDWKIVACIYIETADPSNAKVLASGEGAGYIGLLAVGLSQQGKGLGRQLMRFAEEELRRRGCTRAQLRIINLRTELVGFYGGQGYRATGTSPYPFPSKLLQPVHFVNMEKPL
ncbi:MAG TPA: GNAT family N-acetyltransferase [Candidatus Koribacter sp.]|jgi:predicted N-acetyltransferase YhbS